MIETLKKNKWLFVTEGILLIILGFLAISLPQLATISLGLIISVSLIIIGGISVFRALNLKEEREVYWPFVLTGLLGIASGFLMLNYMSLGIYFITMLIVLYFGFEGISKIIAANILKPLKNTVPLTINGIITLGVAILIMAGLPETSDWIIGLLFGVNLLVSGIALIIFGTTSEKMQPTHV